MYRLALLLQYSNVYVEAFYINSIVANHVSNYGVNTGISMLWTVGFSLMMVMIGRLVTGYCLVTSDITSYGVVALLLDMYDANYGYFRVGVHSIGSSIFMALIFAHMLRSIVYGSYSWLTVGNVFLVGVLIYTISIVVCFLGYSTTYGLMAYWALRVVIGIVRFIPYMDVWFYGNYMVNSGMLSKVFIFHALVAFIMVGLVLVHIVLLHSCSSNSALSTIAACCSYHSDVTPGEWITLMYAKAVMTKYGSKCGYIKVSNVVTSNNGKVLVSCTFTASKKNVTLIEFLNLVANMALTLNDGITTPDADNYIMDFSMSDSKPPPNMVTISTAAFSTVAFIFVEANDTRERSITIVLVM